MKAQYVLFIWPRRHCTMYIILENSVTTFLWWHIDWQCLLSSMTFGMTLLVLGAHFAPVLWCW